MDGRGDLPSQTKLPSGVRPRAFGRSARPTLLPGEVLGADRPRLRAGQPRDVVQPHAEAVEHYPSPIQAVNGPANKPSANGAPRQTGPPAPPSPCWSISQIELTVERCRRRRRPVASLPPPLQ